MESESLQHDAYPITASVGNQPFDQKVLKSPLWGASELLNFPPLNALLQHPTNRRRFTLRTAAIICLIIVLAAGLYVWGWAYRIEYRNPGFWQVSLAAMLFWLSITQGMIALGAVIRLCHASWRYSITRLLDIASLFGTWVGALLPFLVIARERIYALGSSNYNNNIWRVAGSDIWDSIAVGTCYIAGWLLLYLTLLPDFSILRDRESGGSRIGAVSKRVSSFWIFGQQQWAVMRRAEGVLVVGILISFVASQTILGWDFQLAAARDWDSSIFAPLYTLGSLLGGAAMIVLVGTVANRLFKGHPVLENRHYDALARVQLGLGLIWFYFRWCDYLTAWYEHIPSEWQFQGNRITAFPILAVGMLCGCVIVPVIANIFEKVRMSAIGQCVVATCVLIGLAIQRYLDTVPTFAPNYPNSALVPTPGSLVVFFGLAAMFVLTYLITARFIPVVGLWGHAREITRSGAYKFGNGTVTVMLEDPPLWEN